MINIQYYIQPGMDCIISKIRKQFFLLLLVSGFASIYSEGLPGEFLISQQWRDALARYSPLTNVSFLSNAEYAGFQLSQAFTVDNSYKLTEGVFLLPVLQHTFALTYEGVGAGEIDATTPVESQGSFDIISNGKLSDRSNSFILSYAINVWKGLSIGINGHYVYNNILGKKMNAYGGDLGVSYALINDSTWGFHALGLSSQNMFLKGDTKYAGSATFSYIGQLFQKRLELELYVISKDILSHSSDFSSDKDKSYEFDVAFKAGTWLFNFLKVYGQVGNEYAGGSVGIHSPALNKGRDLTLMYQFLFPFGTEYPSHSIFLRSEFGDSRKGKIDKNVNDKMNVIPYNLYNKAMKLFSDGLYWDAYFIFARILVEYPKFVKNDFVSLYSSTCFEHIDIRDAAVSLYQRAMIKYPKSKIHPLARMGVMNIYYRQDNNSGVEEMFNLLHGPHTIDSLRYHAHYLRGETYIKEKKYAEAIEVLSKIPETHQDYIYARHSMAVCAVNQDNYQTALGYLKDCLSTTKTEADKEMTNRTFLFTGYLFYEEKEFANAVAALKMIPRNSYFYEDALLGIAWITLRSRKWDDCTIAGQNLVNNATSDVNKAEGLLIQAYVAMIKKDYNSAAEILNRASVRLNTLTVPSKDDFDKEMEKYKDIRIEYEQFGNSVEEIAIRKQDADTPELIDSMYIDQNEFFNQILEKQNYFDNWNRQNFFARNYEIIREDVDYALARVLKMQNQRVIEKEIEKSEKEEKKLDKEIEKLKNKIDQ